MPVNTAALKTFAPAMRRQLLEAVGRKLDLLLTSQTPDTLSTYAKQIAELREQEEENREQLLERVAYTWFNRLCALRYLDARGWHPFGCKVLMSAAEGETQPELLKLIRAGNLPAYLQSHTDQDRLHGLLDGQIQTAIAGADPQGEVYRELVLAVCRSYHQLLPNLFEGLDDATELLLPDDQITEGSIAGGFRSQISDDDCEDVEIIGWLYQFYISEKKDQVIGKVVKSEDIPAATQLFTPNWIVKYLVQNSLGAQWLDTYPDSALKGQMEYFIEPAEQTDDVKVQLAAVTPESLNPEELTLIDPACGSGHILVEAYELLKAIYLERGYQQREIPQLILENNLFGLDIDQRAAQLTSFALMMKGRRDDRRLFERGIKLNVMALMNSAEFDPEGLANAVNLSEYGLKLADLTELKLLFEHATTFGSLIQVPTPLAEKLPELDRLMEHKSLNLFAAGELLSLGMLVHQMRLLARCYDSVVANPPYMGSKGMNSLAKEFAKTHFPDAKSDQFACFIERGYSLAKPAGYEAMVTMESWMFLSSYENFRNKIISQRSLRNLAHFPYDGKQPTAMGINFGISAITLRNKQIFGYRSHFCCSRFYELDNSGQPQIFPTRNERLTVISTDELKKVPGSPFAYWASERLRKAFTHGKALSDCADMRKGLATGDNGRFLRCWFEVGASKLGLRYASRQMAVMSGMKWFPHNKGGDARKWYGNFAHIINWELDGQEIQNFVDSDGKLRSRPQNLEYSFKQALTWSKITSGVFTARFCEGGCLFDDAAAIGHSADRQLLLRILSILNSKVGQFILQVLNPSVNLQIGDISRTPIIEPSCDHEAVEIAVEECILLARDDWDNLETSWDFAALPLLRPGLMGQALEASWQNWEAKSTASIRRMQELETENNRLFIAAYGLEGELEPEVPEDQITLARADQRKDLAAFLSYATGCMMGRYSLDKPGLILANAGDTLENYETEVGKSTDGLTFQPDPDGIIPVLDGEWFEDDIVARTREFLAVTFPKSSVAENLRFIEESLGKDIRKYFCSEFYKDHLQTYKKRPIYWMVQSPKKGFSCLIYLHRYTKDTLNQVLNNYFRPYLQKLEARLAQLGLDQLNDDLPTRERTAARKEAEKITKVLKECQAWEQDALLPLAQQRIELDLDDGVKVNYLKLQEVLAPIPGLAAKED